MGWRYRRGIRIAPGLRINLSKSGPSLSIGRRGFTTNVGPRGTRTTIGIPGTGIGYQTSARRARNLSTPGPRRTSIGFGRLVGVGALILVGLIIYGASHGGPNQSAAVESPYVTPQVQTVPVTGPVQASGHPVATMNEVPPVPVQTPAPDSSPPRQNVPWRHVTPNGIRWSLRKVGDNALLLVVDLGGGQVANVSVAPAFEALDLPGMNLRVDHIRSVILQSFPVQTANYSFERDGSIRLLP